ncbi:Probable phosphoglycerate mutase [Alloactinosynnema sp. L-07]|uniref:histidine phosphatase family protein n=1 Tax=Alloactinosynnema sp. L-07 TaxID=1653480 RepID=UPI00065EFD4C|nr:histidine phosphatase family protein [Alloactinosynnema sp. L-07]CRK57409.1 Probable phosphoglycerate mutase [Alloactinosynnema sp. L-07]
MSRTLTVVSHAATAATRLAAFPADEPIEHTGIDGGPRADTAVRGPESRCAQTAAALGLSADPDDRLRDCDYGRWRGRTLDEVAAAEPDAVAIWLTDPGAAPHGGETLLDLLDRVGGWLDTPPDGRRTVAVTHPAVAKAMIVRALGADPSAFWRIDIAPLSRTILRGGPGRWTLRWLTTAESAR